MTTPHTFIKAELNGSLTEIYPNDYERFDLLNQNHQIIYYNNVFHFHDWVHNLTIQVDTENEIITLHKNYYSIAEESVKFTNVSNLSTVDLVINVKKCVIVWSYLGFDPSLIQSNYDGSEQTVLYSHSRQAQHLTIDYHSNRYYFVDITDFSLYSIDFDGSNEIFLMKSYSLFNAINGLSVASNALYLSTDYLVYKVPDINSKISVAEVLFEIYDHKQDLKPEFFKVNATVIKREEFTSIFVINVMPEFEDRCLHSECSHICIPIGQSHRCACPDLFSLVNETHCHLDYHADLHDIIHKIEVMPNIGGKLAYSKVLDNSTSKANVFGIINLILIMITMSALGFTMFVLYM